MNTWKVFAPEADSNVPVAPRPAHILCGRGTTAFKREGNQRLRDQIIEHVLAFSQASQKTQKSKIVRFIVATVVSGGGRFLKRIKGGPRAWQLATYSEARQRVSHALRDAATNKVKSMPVLALIKDSKVMKKSKGGLQDMDTNGTVTPWMIGLPAKGENKIQRAVPRESFSSILPMVPPVPDPPPTERSSSLLIGASKDYASIDDCPITPVTLEAMQGYAMKRKSLHEYHAPHLTLDQLLQQETTKPNVGDPCGGGSEGSNGVVPCHSSSGEMHGSVSRGSPSCDRSSQLFEPITLEESLDIFRNSSGVDEEIEEEEIFRTLDAEMSTTMQRIDDITIDDVAPVATIGGHDISDLSDSLLDAVILQRGEVGSKG